MKAETRLDSAVFQLTPTRTRCDLVIIANGKTEKLASGLLNPFLAHLKTAQDQIAKGGYSVTLEPDPRVDAVWFTKGTVERFVRFVSTPEVLERVSTIESEILQIEEAINIQGNDNVAISMVGEGQRKLSGSNEGIKSKADADTEKAIILYKPGTNPPDSNSSTAQEENSKVQLLRVLETRKTVLQKEQAMAFARAVAAGFDMDHMAYLISFAESFGASRLKEACLRFMELWKAKHETGQWIELDAVDALSSRHEFSAFNPSDTWPAPGSDLNGETNGKTANHMTDGRLPSDPQVSGAPHDYAHGQFRHPAFPQWPMHSGPPVFPPYPMQGMPYYPNYPAPPFFQSAYPPSEDSRFTQQRIGKRHSMDSKDSAVDSEVSTRSREGGEQEISEEGSQDLESHKRGSRSGKKKSGVVVIRNINYITSKRRDKSGSDASSASESDDDGETDDSETTQKKHKISSKSSKRKGDKRRSSRMSDMHEKDENVGGPVAEAGNWDVFQSFLLKAEEKNQSSYDKGMFGDEKEPPIRRKLNKGGTDPILPLERDSVDGHESRMVEVHSFNGSISRMRKLASNDGFVLSSGGRSEGHFDEHFKDIEGGGRGYRRTESDDFIVRGQDNQIGGKSNLDHLAENEYQLAGRLEKVSSYAADESFVIPLRTNTGDQLDTESRTDIYMDSELPSSTNDASSRVKNQIIYEPDELSVLPEREIERETIGYDPSMDYDLQVAVGDVLKPENANQKENSLSKKDNNKKSEKKPKASQDDKRKMELLSRRGKTAKASPLTEAQKRAEKLRAFKADLQKEKKEKEEEEMKRLEALKRERQKRIAARNNSNNVLSPLTPKQPGARVSTKAFPSSYKGSKFSDSEPGSSSPLQRLPIRTAAAASSGSQKTTKTSRLSGRSQQAENQLSRSASSLSDLRKEASGPNVEAKAATLRRLSEPKHVNVSRGSSLKSSNDHSVKKNTVSESQAKKVSAIMHLDKTKSAALPELKIRSPKSSDVVQKKATKKEPLQNGLGTSQTSGKTKETHTREEALHLSSGEDNPVVEKTVVMLEKEVVLPTVVQPSEEVAKDRAYLDNGRTKSEFVSEFAEIRAPPSLVDVSKDSNGCNAIAENSFEMVPNFLKDESGKFSSCIATDDKSYHAPFARATSVEDRAIIYTENKETLPVTISEMGTVTESNTAYVPNAMDSNHNEKIQEKFHNKESTKGLRKLLKFGKKGHSSASSERSMDFRSSSVDELAGTASSNDVHLLKNLISQDDPQVGGTLPKASRSFSLLSPFRNKSSDKKQAA